MRVLSEAQTRALISAAEAIAVIESAYADYGREGNVTADPPMALMVVPHAVPSICATKGSFLAGRGLFGVRIGMQKGRHYSTVHDSRSGRMLGLVEETWLARRRVGATAAVAARFLANPAPRIIGLIGAGQLMAEAYLCLAGLFPQAEFRVTSRSAEGAQAFAQKHATAGRPPLRAVPTAAAALDGADLVVSITTARAPMILAGMLKRGATVLSMGGAPEVDFGVLPEFDRVVVDEFDYAVFRGDFADWIAKGHTTVEALRARVDANIGEVVACLKQIRTAADQRILAVIQGMAVCDLAMAAFCLDKAAATGAGTVVPDLAGNDDAAPALPQETAARIAAELKAARARG
jgi:ornithine cyclodeaminase/alanine dehydrogenase-like protein (mu-crystallin family)